MLPELFKEALRQYRDQIKLAEDRLRRFESGDMSVSDLGPPRRDTTAEAVQFERQLIAKYREGVQLLEKLDAEN